MKYGEDNNNWKGGRSITPHGYVLIRVGVGHHLADVRGYAYEHRLVAEKKLCRRLRHGEIAHHDDGNKQNNRPDNIIVVNGNAEHLLLHRTANSNRQLPNQENTVVLCECGCGETFLRFDDEKRPRRFVSGHNPQRASAMNAILATLSESEIHYTEIAERCDLSISVVKTLLVKLIRRSLAERASRGMYKVPHG